MFPVEVQTSLALVCVGISAHLQDEGYPWSAWLPAQQTIIREPVLRRKAGSVCWLAHTAFLTCAMASLPFYFLVL